MICCAHIVNIALEVGTQAVAVLNEGEELHFVSTVDVGTILTAGLDELPGVVVGGTITHLGVARESGGILGEAPIAVGATAEDGGHGRRDNVVATGRLAVGQEEERRSGRTGGTRGEAGRGGGAVVLAVAALDLVVEHEVLVEVETVLGSGGTHGDGKG